MPHSFYRIRGCRRGAVDNECVEVGGYVNKVHYSSKSDKWATPQEFFDRYDAIYGFETDVCALPENAKCKKYYTPEVDGLSQKWTGVCWMNPPYGREIGKWVRKAYESARDDNATVVCLLPARTDTAWFQDYVFPYASLEFIRSRIKFGGAKNGAPFPSVVAVFCPENLNDDVCRIYHRSVVNEQ